MFYFLAKHLQVFFFSHHFFDNKYAIHVFLNVDIVHLKIYVINFYNCSMDIC